MTPDEKPKQQRRVKVELPSERVERYREVTRRRGHTGSALAYNAVITAARLAMRGEYAYLPAKSSAPARAGAQKPIDITQSAEESARCAAAIADAGSSVRAVVASYVEAYLAADGDQFAMRWPVRRQAEWDEPAPVVIAA